MKLQAVTVSVNYSDFLAYTIEENKNLFDKWIIITDLSDFKTKQLCELHNITCVQTDIFYTKGLFNKFAAINEGLKLVDDDAWVLFLDSDIALHNETRRVLENLNLDKANIYGIDRLNCIGEDAWLEYKESDGVLVGNWMLQTAGLEIGSRLVHYYGHQGDNGAFGGWNPLGYFQLAHKSAFTTYPQDSLSADHCDLVFASQWPRANRCLIPEIYGIHLESVSAYQGVNWAGRKSLPFSDEEDQDDDYIFSYEYDISDFDLKSILLKIKRFLINTYYKVITFFIKKKYRY